MHVHLENNIPFPHALELENQQVTRYRKELGRFVSKVLDSFVDGPVGFLFRFVRKHRQHPGRLHLLPERFDLNSEPAFLSGTHAAAATL